MLLKSFWTSKVRKILQFFLFLLLKDAKPSEEEKELHRTVATVLDKGPTILDRLLKYEGCEEFIRKVTKSVFDFNISDLRSGLFILLKLNRLLLLLALKLKNQLGMPFYQVRLFYLTHVFAFGLLKGIFCPSYKKQHHSHHLAYFVFLF